MLLRASSGLGSRQINPSISMRRTWWETRLFSHPSIARRAAEDAGRDPDALKKAIRINLEPGTSVDSVAGKLERFAGSGVDEAFVDAFAAFPSLDQMLDFASHVIARWSDRGKA